MQGRVMLRIMCSKCDQIAELPKHRSLRLRLLLLVFEPGGYDLLNLADAHLPKIIWGKPCIQRLRIQGFYQFGYSSVGYSVSCFFSISCRSSCEKKPLTFMTSKSRSAFSLIVQPLSSISSMRS